MKPLSEWTEQALRDAMIGKEPVTWDHLGDMLDELLRRKERETIERCAKECDDEAADCRRGSEALSELGMPADMCVRARLSAIIAKQLAARIRGLP